MKSVLISIQPKWAEKIASGKKTIEVRKTRPKLETPFKCYIYATKSKRDEIEHVVRYSFRSGISFDVGRVIGEFVCDDVEMFVTDYRREEAPFNKILKESCLTFDECANYDNGKCLYGWHTSDLKIYDTPKELGEFCYPCHKPQSRCAECPKYEKPFAFDIDETTGKFYCTRRMSRPPQSWCYVEEL